MREDFDLIPLAEDDPWRDATECSSEREDKISPPLPHGQMSLEGALGLLAAFFIGLPTPLFAGVAAANLLPPQVWWLGIPLGLATGYLSLLVVRLAVRATEGDHHDGAASGRIASSQSLQQQAIFTASQAARVGTVPLAIAMAIRLPNWPLLLRPLIGLWWLAHFGAAALFGHIVAAFAAKGLNNAGWILTMPLTLVATFAFLFAGNLYLMLAVAACVRLPTVWLIVWRNRFLVDLILASILLFAGR